MIAHGRKKRQEWEMHVSISSSSHLFGCLAAALAVGLLLSGCGGGGGASAMVSVNPIMPPEPGPDPVIDLDPDPTTDLDPGTKPDTVIPSVEKRGPWAISGIDRIPLDLIKATNSQMKDMLAIADYGQDDHAISTRETLCESYITGCENSESYHGQSFNSDGSVTFHTGSAPYSAFDDGGPLEGKEKRLNAQFDAMSNLKIAVETVDPLIGRIHGDEPPPFLVIQSRGNGGHNRPFDISDLFNEEEVSVRIKEAIQSNRLIYTAGWARDTHENYIRHPDSSSCLGDVISGGCIWTRMEFPTGVGTSLSAPHFAGALASVLSVFPDTTYQDLAEFGKACARKTSDGIPDLLRNSGGIGVADFNCMGDVVDALVNLPTGGATNVSINGQSVQVRGRDLALPFTSSNDAFRRNSVHIVSATTEEENLSFDVVSDGRGSTTLVGTYKPIERMIASVAVGSRDDFFGFTEGHDLVTEQSIKAGHENLFLVLSGQQSTGGHSINFAQGSSFAIATQERFSLTEHTSLVVLAEVEQFLGGKATIPTGTVRLNKGAGWNRRLLAESETTLSEDVSLGLSATVFSPHGQKREEYALSAKVNWRF